MIESRIAKIVIVGSLAIFALLVTFDNLTDYNTTCEFVRHMLSMDTTFPGNGLLYRRVISPDLCQAAYALIILGEGLTGLTLLIAAVVLLWHVRSDAARFNRAKRLVHIGAALGFLVWFFRASGRRRRVVSGGAVADLEWSAGGFSLLRDYSRSADFRQPVGRRPPKGLSSQDGARVSG